MHKHHFVCCNLKCGKERKIIEYKEKLDIKNLKIKCSYCKEELIYYKEMIPDEY